MRAPTGLLCDLLAGPSVIATTQPTFGWIPEPDPGETPVACHVLVASRAEFLQPGAADLWDTGRLAFTDSLHLPYAGAPLQPDATYHWCVRLWGRADEPGPWSSPQTFTLTPDASPGQTSRHAVRPWRHAPASLRALNDTTWFADFGRHAFGWLEVTLEAPADGTVIEIRLGEKAGPEGVDLQPGGTIRSACVTLKLRAGRHTYRIETPRDERNTSGAAVLLPAEFGIVLPFRYVELRGCPVAPSAGDLKQVRLEYPFDDTAAAFASSNSALDAVWAFCRYSIRATTFCGVYVDGDRERIPYEADAYLNQLGHYAVDREFALARHSHEYLLEQPTWPTEWKQHSVLMAWADYEATGDTRSLARHYDVLRREKIYLDRARPDGLVDTSDLRDIVDWPGGERDDYDFRPVNTVVNAFHCHTLTLMARIADALGKTADAAKFTAAAEHARASFHRVLFDPAAGCYRDGEGSAHHAQHASFFPLAFGLVPAAEVRRVATFVKSLGMACSVYAAQYLLEALFLAGEADHAIRLMTSNDVRSWRNMLRQGATITWEAWDNRFKPNQDWNHAWGAAPANIIPRFILGVRPLEPGWSRVLVAPQPGPLTELHGIVPSIRGPIHVDATLTPNGIWHLDARAPTGVSLTLRLPPPTRK